MLPVCVQPNSLKQYLTDYHEYKYEETNYDDYTAYEVISAKDVRERITDYLGKVLARCWINPSLLKELEADPHQCLYEMGMILPEELTIHVVNGKKDRPRLVVYEIENGKQKKICYLQLSMIASRS